MRMIRFLTCEHTSQKSNHTHRYCNTISMRMIRFLTCVFASINNNVRRAFSAL